MNLLIIVLIVLTLSALPCALFVINLFIYRPIEKSGSKFMGSVSVLIPARNEEQNICATLEAVLANRGADFEVIVLDDHSTDRTVEIVSEFAHKDNRIRLESAPPLPPGWCGKQHACHVLARLARHSLWVFMDADVRLAPDALARMAGFMDRTKADLASGVPHQELGTFSERLLIPLIHFILLGFLPMHVMRLSKWSAFSAGCGQLLIARREAYRQSGGHAMIRNSLHDGIQLPRIFRRAGFRTSLFDATDLAACRMYRTNGDVWRGLGKNAIEGLAAPTTIIPMTALLFGGQVLPFILLAFVPKLTAADAAWTVLSVTLAYLPRMVGAWRFNQPLNSALYHPFGVIALLVIQWKALARSITGKPSEWKGRSYQNQSALWRFFKPASPAPIVK